MNSKKLLAELIGTFTLTIIVLLSSLSGSTLTPVFAGIVLGLFVYTIGSISGCHINPAVTIGFLSLKKIENKEALFYIVFQFLGALLALLAAVIYGFDVSKAGNLNTPAIFLSETVGAALFTFGIAAVVIGKVNDGVKGVVIGTSLFMGITLALLLGGVGFLNPAVALGNFSLNLSTLLGPIAGSLIGMQIYLYLVKK